MSELQDRAAEIRAIAHNPKCKTVNDLAKAFGWTMEIARHANQVLNLDLPDARLKTGPAKAAQAHPKPVKRK